MKKDVLNVIGVWLAAVSFFVAGFLTAGLLIFFKKIKDPLLLLQMIHGCVATGTVLLYNIFSKDFCNKN